MSDEASKSDGAKELVSAGSEIAGAAVGGALGFLAAGPIGLAMAGAAGAVAARALGKVGNEVAERFLGPRERMRVGGVIALAAVKINERIEAGERVRSDQFFANEEDSRSEADEAIESALLKAQREAEEKKLPFLANLIAESTFNPLMNSALIQQLLKMAESLTYNQFCLLKIYDSDATQHFRQDDYKEQKQFDFALMQILYETFDLYNRGMLSFGGEAILSIPQLMPGKARVQGLGKLLHDSMKLNEIPKSDTLQIMRLLAPSPETRDLQLGKSNFSFGANQTSSTNRP